MKHISFRFLFSVVVLLLVLGACTDRIDINTKDAEPRLIIYGYITTDTMQHAIKIARSNGYFATTEPEGISNAIVTISTDNQTLALAENAAVRGLYQTETNVFGIEGKTYTLTISLDFNRNGQTEQYQAISYLPHSAQLDSITLRPSAAFIDHIEVLLYAKLPESTTENYYCARVFRNDQPINDSISRFTTFDDKYIINREVKGVACYYLDQEEEISKLVPGDTVTLQVDAITKEYSEFIDHAQDEIRGSIPFFSGPPANIETNIKSLNPADNIPVSGFFTAYSGKKKSTIYK